MNKKGKNNKTRVNMKIWGLLESNNILRVGKGARAFDKSEKQSNVTFIVCFRFATALICLIRYVASYVAHHCVNSFCQQVEGESSSPDMFD